MKGNSWGHEIRLQSPNDRRPCAGPLCKADPVYLTGYLCFRSRRSVRVGGVIKGACAEHGRKFAEKHGLELP